MTGHRDPHGVHTAGNAVPAVDGTAVGRLLDDLDGFHPGIDLIRDGIRLIATDRLTTDQTQTLVSVLAGATGSDVLTAIGQLVARITNPDTNPSLRHLDFDQQKTAEGWGAYTAFTLAHTDIHQHASEAAAAITGI
ncbi:hypothetical protein PV382_18125 [Streptomyces scabiei]|uniref:hypothetical protein n=1 Tax=Streptomyces scabiei TaxID=1930 RepID=UPI0029B202FD|nr:hypothetical protein [Streptomyces scabiei]MDX2658260.1 hypothetical protein [Streptomyces scabiei]MDX2870545.1 hypothetical protein [Streptomyces scabiei]MDX3174195.1 hypothetical protein [Streptomyces scabiei]